MWNHRCFTFLRRSCWLLFIANEKFGTAVYQVAKERKASRNRECAVYYIWGLGTNVLRTLSHCDLELNRFRTAPGEQPRVWRLKAIWNLPVKCLKEIKKRWRSPFQLNQHEVMFHTASPSVCPPWFRNTQAVEKRQIASPKYRMAKWHTVGKSHSKVLCHRRNNKKERNIVLAFRVDK